MHHGGWSVQSVVSEWQCFSGVIEGFNIKAKHNMAEIALYHALSALHVPSTTYELFWRGESIDGHPPQGKNVEVVLLPSYRGLPAVNDAYHYVQKSGGT